MVGTQVPEPSLLPCWRHNNTKLGEKQSKDSNQALHVGWWHSEQQLNVFPSHRIILARWYLVFYHCIMQDINPFMININITDYFICFLYEDSWVNFHLKFNTYKGISVLKVVSIFSFCVSWIYYLLLLYYSESQFWSTSPWKVSLCVCVSTLTLTSFFLILISLY